MNVFVAKMNGLRKYQKKEKSKEKTKRNVTRKRIVIKDNK